MHVLLATSPQSVSVLPALFTLSHPKVHAGFDIRAFLDATPDSVGLLDFRPDCEATVDFARQIRQVDATIPLIGIFNSGNLRTISPSWGLTDFVVDTISARELQARLDRAVLRNVRTARENAVVPLPDGGSLRVDGDSRGLHLGGRYIPLTVAEFEVFQVLVTEPGRVFRRDELVSVWDSGRTPTINAVTIVILRIRRKLGDQADLIRTVRGVGYQLAAAAEVSPAAAPAREDRIRRYERELV